MAEPVKKPSGKFLPPGPKRKLVLIGIVAVVGAFVLSTFTQNWGKATAQRDIKAAENAAKACIASPRTALKQCAFAEQEISAALPELETSDKKDLIQLAQKHLAEVYMATGKYDKAAELYSSLAAVAPQQSESYRDLALAYSMAGKHRAAQHFAGLSVQLAPDSWKAHALQSRILARVDEPAAALAALEQAFALAPKKEQPALRQAIDKMRALQPEQVP